MSNTAGGTGTAQAIITLKVAPGNEAAFRALEGRLAAAEQGFPGFLASEMIRPVPGVQEHWALRLQFDSPQRLRAWLESEQRHQLLQELVPLLLEPQKEQTLAT